VADGGSADGTVDYLRQSGVRLIEGPDRSLHDGLNQALAAAAGDYLVWLKADDALPPGGRRTSCAARGLPAPISRPARPRSCAPTGWSGGAVIMPLR
jgi:hypothetical protein